MLRRAMERVETEGVRERVAVVDADFTDLDPDALRRALASLDDARKEANSDSDAALPGFDLACVFVPPLSTWCAGSWYWLPTTHVHGRFAGLIGVKRGPSLRFVFCSERPLQRAQDAAL